MKAPSINRRDFLKSAAVAAATGAFSSRVIAQAGTQTSPQKIKLGLDNFSVRSMGWKAPALIEYAASLKTDSLFITDLDAFENFDDTFLKGLRTKAAEAGLQIH